MSKTETKNERWRLYLLLAGILALAAVFVYHLYNYQIVQADMYRLQADNQFRRSGGSAFNRGSIFFTTADGNLLPAATLSQDFWVVMDPRLINRPEDNYDRLVSILPDLDKEEFLIKAGRQNSAYQEIARNLTEEEADAIKALNLRAVSVVANKIRHYPAGRTASHVLGFLGYDGHALVGRYGLERSFNDLLDHDSVGSFASFFAEVFFGWRADTGVSSLHGDLVTTLEPTVQRRVEQEMREAAERFSAEGAGVIVVDPRDGKILAMASWPDFNPGESQSDLGVLDNPLVERVFEMGSVFKPLTMAAGFDAGVVSTDTTYNDSGSVVLDGYRIHNHDRQGRGVADMQTVMNNSLNTGAIFVMQRLGIERFRDYMLGFGLGYPARLGLPGEIGGLVSNLNSSRQVEHATVSFGQGIAVTPIGAVRAFTALANGGYVVNPYLIEEIRYSDGRVEVPDRPEPVKLLSEEASEEITQMLVSAFDNVLLGGRHRLDNYSIASKTGTAQIARTDGRGYEEGRNLHSFFGYYPAYEPRFLVFSYLINPKGARFASDSLVDPFVTIADFLLNYYEVPPDRGLLMTDNESIL